MIIRRHDKKISITERQAQAITAEIWVLWDTARDYMSADEKEESELIRNQIYQWLKTTCPECGADVIANKCTSTICNQNDRS